MQNFSNYQRTDTIITSSSWMLYKAVSSFDKEAVLIKTSNSQALAQAKAELIHEYYTLSEVDLYGVLKPVALEKNKEQPYLIMEYFQGEQFTSWLRRNQNFDIHTFLKTAVKLTSILFSVHQKNIIHKSIMPDHILYDPNTDQFRLTGFHQSTTLSKEMPQADITPYQIEEVAYVSPEQTGRMNRPIDYRTDLYSLGVLFYQIATGHVPFAMEDPAEVIHAHLAQTAVPPHKVNPAVPEVISNIIMKLLAKIPEQRYQSTNGLKKDLEKCFHHFHVNAEVESFVLGEFDTNPGLEKPNKLYGRDQELEQLIRKFDHIQYGSPALVLIPGPSGIGKTALVRSLYQPLLKKKGYFITGKFVQFQKHIPYAPIIEAFRSLIRQVLTEDADRIKAWQDKLSASLSDNAWVIGNFIPEIEWLLGKQEQGPDIPPQGVHNRFLLAVRKFVDVFATENHPLILFIDDLQWADNATLDVMNHLLTNPYKRNLLIIGAYRDNEVSIGHPFELFLNQLKNREVPVSQIPVSPLTKNYIEQWVKEILDLEAETSKSLVELIYRITRGNPFFIIQLLQLLNQEKIISFDLSIATWQVNLTALKQIPMTDSMIDFIIKQVNKLPEKTIKRLQLAACIGSQFNLTLLATIAGEDYVETSNSLWHGLEEGVILPMDARYKWVYPNENESLLNDSPPSYRFLHDKIQQALYTSMTVGEREESHLRIAEELIHHYTEEEIEDHIFQVVNHFNLCQDRLNKEQKRDLIKWNRMAGEKAKRAAAFESAWTFFAKAFGLLPENKWQVDYKETFNVMAGYGEALYLNQHFEQAENIFEEILTHAETKQEKLYIYNLKITVYTHIHEVEKATISGLAGLRLFGIEINNKPNKLVVAREYLLTKLALGKKSGEDLLNIPPVTDKDQQIIMRTFINTNAPTYHVDQNLATIIMLRALRLTLKYGDLDLSALVYNNYALTLSAGFGDYEGSNQFGRLAIKHAERSGDKALQARVYFVFGSFVNHWKKHIRYNLEYLERSQQLSIENGNLYLAGASGAFIGLTLLIKGDNLEQVEEGIRRQVTFAKKNEYAISDDFLTELLDWIAILSTSEKTPTWEFTEFTDDKSATIMHKTIRLQMAYFFNNRPVALSLMEELEPLVDNTMVLVVAPEYFFYHALWVTKLIKDGELSKKEGFKKLKKDLTKLEKWAKHSPSNYLHKYLLILAEKEQLIGKDSAATEHYHQAIEAAEKNEFLQDLALSNHCAANFYLDRQLPKTAKSYMTEAYNGYLNWGSVRLADQIKATHPELLLETKQSVVNNGATTESLDTKAIFEAARIISSEVVLNKLISRLMDIVLTYAGAEHTSFLLYHDEKLEVVSYNHIDRNVEIYKEAKTVDKHTRVSSAIVRYVMNSREAVVLDHASENGAFTEDVYIQETDAKSVLCLPIIYQDKLVACLYMENNKSTHVFTRERLNILRLIASQAAVSIENAYLYADLEEKVSKRTDLLNDANQRLTTVNQELTNSKERMKHLLSNVSHDLQSPVAVVQGYVGAILDGLVEDPSKQQEYLTIINNRMGGLNKLIKDLFDLSKLESGNMNFSMEAIPVNQLFEHFCSMFALEIKEAGLEFIRKFDEDQAEEFPLVEVDVTRLEQVMTNLISNAIKHTKKGAIEIGLTISKSQGAIFSIRDEGSGISHADIPYVFDRYYTKSDHQGNGLGLAISKEIVNFHMGDFWVESKEKQGTIFQFSIPVYSVGVPESVR
ncbi:ATP-binding sensor histidine kinase [Saliterribacillus persicus]|uniref:histidine kinase n=1 Tax=Saliterribacillus persicus TaxID=930114 RepID=A0A368Y9M4_9BACI|nr:ATP-binding sensor histidine kinase [Saliterribacillus persicus]RCW76971.1 putative ATPase [Saliterribacillus persicus]